jgi:hypothetical protein
MCSVSEWKVFSFKNGEVYEHNQSQTNGRNNAPLHFSSEPSLKEKCKNEIEGTDAWDMELTSDQDSGYIHKDFVNQENVLEHIQELLTKLLTHHCFLLKELIVR